MSKYKISMAHFFTLFEEGNFECIFKQESCDKISVSYMRNFFANTADCPKFAVSTDKCASFIFLTFLSNGNFKTSFCSLN